MGMKLAMEAVEITGLRNVKIEDAESNTHTAKLPGVPKDFSVKALVPLVPVDKIPARVNRTDNFRRSYDTALDSKAVKKLFGEAKDETPGS